MLKTIYLTALFCLLTPLCAVAENTTFYKELMKLPASELYQKGLDLRYKENKPDEALACYVVMRDRYGDNAADADTELMARGLSQMAFIYFFYYYDYSAAFDCLNQAQELCEKLGRNVLEVDLYQGLLYASLSEQSLDTQTTDEALKYLALAFDEAEKENHTHYLNLAFANTLVLDAKQDNFEHTASLWPRYKIHQQDSTEPEEMCFMRFISNSYEGLNALNEQRHDVAIDKFEEIISALPRDKSHMRYILSAMEFKALACMRNGRYEQALGELDNAIALAREFNVKEALLEFYRIKTEIFTRTGDANALLEAKSHYLEIKDSLLDYRKVVNMEQQKSLNELRKAGKEYAEQHAKDEEKRHRAEIFLIFAAVAATVLGFLSFLLFRKYRQLRVVNKSLYLKNAEMLDADRQHQEQRREYLSRIEELKDDLRRVRREGDTPGNETSAATAISGKSDNSDSAADGCNPDICAADSCPECSGECNCTDEGGKYRNSSLSDDYKADLLTRILNVMEENREILNPDFSLMRLSEILHVNYKYVSQVINETYGCNFSSLLSDYRINEACRRLSDTEAYGNITIEALSQDVGFKSRTSFIAHFKKRTGLTPSQYQQEARSNR